MGMNKIEGYGILIFATWFIYLFLKDINILFSKPISELLDFFIKYNFVLRFK